MYLLDVWQILLSPVGCHINILGQLEVMCLLK